MTSHGAALREASDDEELAASVMNDWRTARLDPPDRALCAFAERLTASPARMEDGDVDALRAQGFADEAICDAVQVIAWFNYRNRVVKAPGSDLEPGRQPAPRASQAEQPPVVPPPRDAAVTLEAVTKDNFGAVLRLQVSPYQQRFVASNAISLAQSTFHPGTTCLAVAAGGVPVGFTMFELQPEEHALYVVRFMIDARFQGLGFGKAAMARIAEHARMLEGVTRVTLSYVPAPGSPERFYASLGFVATGALHEGELEMELRL
jgi:diamine N-acetyltransferase